MPNTPATWAVACYPDVTSDAVRFTDTDAVFIAVTLHQGSSKELEALLYSRRLSQILTHEIVGVPPEQTPDPRHEQLAECWPLLEVGGGAHSSCRGCYLVLRVKEG